MKNFLCIFLALLFSVAQGTGTLPRQDDLRISRAWTFGDNTIGPGGDWYEVTNIGTVNSYDLTGWLICARFSYAAMSAANIRGTGSLMLAPGQSVQLYSAVDFSETSSDIGLYIDQLYTEPASMVTFFQYGGGNIGRASVAVNGGLWTAAGDFVNVAPGVGNTYALIGTPVLPLAPTDFNNAETGQVPETTVDTNSSTATDGQSSSASTILASLSLLFVLVTLISF